MKRVFIALAFMLLASEAGAEVITSPLRRALADALYLQLAGGSMTGDLSIVKTDARISFAGSTTSSKLIFALQGIAGPAFTTASAGEKFVFRTEVDASHANYAAGIDTSTMWFGVPQTNGGYAFKWYGGTTLAATLTDTGALYTTGLSRADGNVFRVTGDFTSASSTSLQTITGLSWVLPASTAANYPFHCEILYNQTVAAVADAFGIQAASLAPTNIAASGLVQTAAGTFGSTNLPTLSTTTATNIVTFTPSAITTIWRATLDGMIENPSGVANTINIMVSQSTAADLMVIKRGSYCICGN